jgi:CheY-like chemotaxis protein
MNPGPVLLIEDDLDIRESLLEALADEGYAAKGAIDGLDALELLRAGVQPSVILLDLTMPRMNGAQLREELQKVPGWAAIPFVVVTADAHARSKAAAMGASSYMKKPVSLLDVFHALEGILGRRV